MDMRSPVLAMVKQIRTQRGGDLQDTSGESLVVGRICDSSHKNRHLALERATAKNTEDKTEFKLQTSGIWIALAAVASIAALIIIIKFVCNWTGFSARYGTIA